MVSILYARGGGGGSEGGKGRKPCDCPYQLAMKRGGERGEQTNLVLDFSLVLISCTTPPLVSLSLISRSAGRPLSIKKWI